MRPEIIHIRAKMLGRTEASIRSVRQDGASWLPPFLEQGKRVCWRVTTVRKFLEEYEQGLHGLPNQGGDATHYPDSKPLGYDIG